MCILSIKRVSGAFFLFCPFAMQVWMWIWLTFGVLVHLISFHDLLSSFATSSIVSLSGDLLRTLPLFGCWIIWIAMNSAYYKGVSLTLAEVVHLFMELLCSCSLSRPFSSSQPFPSHLACLDYKQFRRCFLSLHWSLLPVSYYKDSSSIFNL